MRKGEDGNIKDRGFIKYGKEVGVESPTSRGCDVSVSQPRLVRLH